MYKTGALLRPQHFSEFHKCWTNGVRKPGVAGGGAAPAPRRAGPRKRGFTGDRTQYSPPSPEPRGAARAASRGWAGWGEATRGGGCGHPRSVLSAQRQHVGLRGTSGGRPSFPGVLRGLGMRERGPLWARGGGCSEGNGFRVSALEQAAGVWRGMGLGPSRGHSTTRAPGSRGHGEASPGPRVQTGGLPALRGRRPPTPISAWGRS